MLALCHHHQSSYHPNCILFLVPHTTYNVSVIPRNLLPTIGKLANALGRGHTILTSRELM
jgi:hypothetical protein